MYNPHVLGDMKLDFTILLPLDRPLSLLPFRMSSCQSAWHFSLASPKERLPFAS